MQFGFDCNFMKGEGGGEIDRGDPLESYSTGELFIRGWKRSLKVSLSITNVSKDFYIVFFCTANITQSLNLEWRIVLNCTSKGFYIFYSLKVNRFDCVPPFLELNFSYYLFYFRNKYITNEYEPV